MGGGGCANIYPVNSAATPYSSTVHPVIMPGKASATLVGSYAAHGVQHRGRSPGTACRCACCSRSAPRFSTPPCLAGPCSQEATGGTRCRACRAGHCGGFRQRPVSVGGFYFTTHAHTHTKKQKTKQKNPPPPPPKWTGSGGESAGSERSYQSINDACYGTLRFATLGALLSDQC